MGEKVALMGGVVTGMLIWGTGQWDRGVRWPRRWVGITNRGLRGMNAKIVVIKGPWWKETLGHLSSLFPFSSFFAHGSSYHYIDFFTEQHSFGGNQSVFEEEEGAPQEEDLSPGGDYIKLLLLPKPFSPDFRENWELYRLEYWEKENERRAHLRQLVQKSDIALARKHSRWVWGWEWRGSKKVQNNHGKGDIEKSQHRHYLEKEAKRNSFIRLNSYSRNASRNSAPASIEGEERPTRTRRGSTTVSASERRKKAPRSSTYVESNNLSKLNSFNRPI